MDVRWSGIRNRKLSSRLKCIPRCRFNFYIEKAQKQHPLITKAKCWYFFRLKEGDDYIVCGTFASLKYSPQEKDLKSSVVQNTWSHPDI